MGEFFIFVPEEAAAGGTRRAKRGLAG